MNEGTAKEIINHLQAVEELLEKEIKTMLKAHTDNE